MKKYRFILFAGFAASGLFLSSCGNESGNSEEANNNAPDKKEATKDTAAKNIFYALPSPIEIAQLMQKAGATYNSKLLNPIENAPKYTSTNSKALNLGVYGADLSYTTIFDQSSETIIYLNQVKKLSDGLGIAGAFTDKTVNRMDANKGNRDSLLNIISDSYFETDDYLKENQRAHTSSLVMAGGWIEGLYIGTQVSKSIKDNTALATRIAELKGSLNNLIAMLEQYKGAMEVASLLGSLKEIKGVYDQVQGGDNKPKVSTDPKTGVTTIGGGSKFTLTPDQLKSISDKIDVLRNKIIQP